MRSLTWQILILSEYHPHIEDKNQAAAEGFKKGLIKSLLDNFPRKHGIHQSGGGKTKNWKIFKYH